jgi:hypothetical protein
MDMTARRGLRWYHYLLIGLLASGLLLTLLVAAGVAWLRVQMNEQATKRKQEFIARVMTTDGLVRDDTLVVNDQVTDADLEHLRAFPQLRELILDNSQITDAGLEHLKGLANLQTLSLVGTHVTDGGLERLGPLKGLTLLDLKDTAVTDEGVKKLQQSLPNCRIER